MSSNASDLQRGNGGASCAPCVLLVDDEVAVRTALRRFFERRGWRVAEAADGICAREMFVPNERRLFDLVICDLKMPRSSGCDLYRWLMRSRPDVIGTVVFSTGDVHSADTVAFLAEVQRPVLSKPFELGELVRIVSEVSGAAHAA